MGRITRILAGVGCTQKPPPRVDDEDDGLPGHPAGYRGRRPALLHGAAARPLTRDQLPVQPTARAGSARAGGITNPPPGWGLWGPSAWTDLMPHTTRVVAIRTAGSLSIAAGARAVRTAVRETGASVPSASTILTR